MWRDWYLSQSKFTPLSGALEPSLIMAPQKVQQNMSVMTSCTECSTSQSFGEPIRYRLQLIRGRLTGAMYKVVRTPPRPG